MKSIFAMLYLLLLFLLPSVFADELVRQLTGVDDAHEVLGIAGENVFVAILVR